MKRTFFFICTLVLFAGCLKTVADLREEAGEPLQPYRQTASQNDGANERVAVKPAPATAASRFEEYDEQLRQLNGRIDLIENQVSQLSSARQGERQNEGKDRQQLEQRLQAYEEELKKLEAVVQAQSEELAHVKAMIPPPPPAPALKGRGAYDEGEELIVAKKWKEAIVAFQRYRDANPKGKMYPDATYKIGLAFKELGMKDEARAFFEEVSAKFPNSKEAKKAGVQLKSIK